jgi:hypothetical protein
MSELRVEPHEKESDNIDVDGFIALREQFIELNKMMTEIKENKLSKNFSGFTFLYAARFFYKLGQLHTSAEFIKHAIENLGKNHPFVEDCKKEYEKYLEELKTPPKELLNPQKEVRLWIFTDAGFDLYHYNNFEKVDPVIIVGFFSAIRSFCKVVNEKPLSAIIIEKEKYHFYQEPNSSIYIAGLFPNTWRQNEIRTALKHVYSKFQHKYSKLLENFTGDMVPFQKFRINFEELKALNTIPDESLLLSILE